MSDRAAPRDTQYDHQGEMVQQLIDWDRLSLYTAMPGIIEQYNARTRRASVRPALRVVWADDEEVDRPILHNVQVVWPRGRHGSLHFRLQKGDPVWLMFSMAGLQEFRQTHRLATPDEHGGHAMKDAVAFAGFGAVQEIEAIDDYDTWQSDDGKRSFRMNESTVELHNEDSHQIVRADGIEIDADGDLDMSAQGNINMTATGAVNVTAGGAFAVTSGSMTHNGTNVGDDHTHSGVSSGPARTGTPQ